MDNGEGSRLVIYFGLVVSGYDDCPGGKSYLFLNVSFTLNFLFILSYSALFNIFIKLISKSD